MPVKEFNSPNKPWIKIALERDEHESTHFIVRANFLLTRPIIELAQRIKGVSAVPAAARYEMLVVMSPLFNYQETEQRLVDHIFTHAPSEEEVMDQEYKDWLAVHAPEPLSVPAGDFSWRPSKQSLEDALEKAGGKQQPSTYVPAKLPKLPAPSTYEQHKAAGTLHLYAPPMGLESLYAYGELKVLVRPVSEPITHATPWVGAMLAAEVLLAPGDIFMYRLRPSDKPRFIKVKEYLGPNHVLCVPCKWQWWAALSFAAHNERRAARVLEYLAMRNAGAGGLSWLDKYLHAAGMRNEAE